jgi:tetratricopeptide (TPR) repeat protein
LKQGDAKQAVDSVRRALLFVPSGWCPPYTTLSDAYRKLGQAPQAEYAGAMLALCEKRTDEATRTLSTLTSGPAAVDAMVGLGMIAEQAGRKTEAISWYQKVLERDPANAAALYALSWLGVKPSRAPTAGSSSSVQGAR